MSKAARWAARAEANLTGAGGGEGSLGGGEIGHGGVQEREGGGRGGRETDRWAARAAAKRESRAGVTGRVGGTEVVKGGVGEEKRREGVQGEEGGGKISKAGRWAARAAAKHGSGLSGAGVTGGGGREAGSGASVTGGGEEAGGAKANEQLMGHIRRCAEGSAMEAWMESAAAKQLQRFVAGKRDFCEEAAALCRASSEAEVLQRGWQYRELRAGQAGLDAASTASAVPAHAAGNILRSHHIAFI